MFIYYVVANLDVAIRREETEGTVLVWEQGQAESS